MIGVGGVVGHGMRSATHSIYGEDSLATVAWRSKVIILNIILFFSKNSKARG